MPVPRRAITLDGAKEEIAKRSFAATEGNRDRIGLEIEWFVVDTAEPDRRVDPAETHAVLPGRLPAGGNITFEPGGQLELSTAPHATVHDLLDATTVDLRAIEAALRPAGLVLRGGGVDPRPSARRFVDAPRYRAMEAFFDLDGPDGRTMMRSTAALQLNVDASLHRWHLAHALEAPLTAAFAPSPRRNVWTRIDTSRTAPPPLDGWIDYALAARVMCIRVEDANFVTPGERLTLERWVADGHELGWPTPDDVAYHLTTLFPPVRPRGWLEIRYLDAPEPDQWQVPVAVVAALLLDCEAGQAAADGGTTEACFAAAIAALPRLGVDRSVIAACADVALSHRQVPAWT